jgi:lipid-A-disaccharide synthase
MPTPNEKYRVFISAAEPSADVHCANLITAFKARAGDAAFFGIGGHKMAAAGCRLLEDTTHRAAMAHKSIKEVAHYWRLLRRVKRTFRLDRPDLVIVCDSPSFNFHVAKAAKRAGIQTMFYVAPQLWAWGSWRISKLRRHCDRLCCILPFEEQWFRQRGVQATFVGNPLLDAVGHDLSRNARTYSDLHKRPMKVVILPGSRTAEIETLWKPMQQIALKLRARYPDIQFMAVAVNERRKHQLRAAEEPGFQCEYSVDSVYSTASSADFALVASGSATLEVAAAGCPMIVMYQTNRLLWHLFGRWLVRSRFFSLANLIADRELVTEFMPYFTSIDPIAERAASLLADAASLTRLSHDLVAIAAPLAGRDASAEAATIIQEMLATTR